MAISLKSAQPHAPDEIAMTDTHALIPAAGVGERMGLKIPKQYESLAGRPLMAHAIETLCAHEAVRKVFVVLAPGDMRFRELDWGAYTDKIEALYCGGATRAATVFNGLQAMQGQVQRQDWVMVHDAARPCVRASDLDRMLDRVDWLINVPAHDQRWHLDLWCDLAQIVIGFKVLTIMERLVEVVNGFPVVSVKFLHQLLPRCGHLVN